MTTGRPVAEVLATGPLTTVQDLGRPGYAALGVARSGAFDRVSLQAANRLVGNAEGAAALEITAGGLILRTTAAVTVALSGARCPGLDHGVALTLPAGVTVRLDLPPTGLRSYLALRGGVLADRSLGSSSADVLSGLGPAPLRSGDVVSVGRLVVADVSGAAVIPNNSSRSVVDAGPRTDWFGDDVLFRLCRTAWTVRPDSDRIGVRLEGPALQRVRAGELPSEPTLPGSIQVPPDGRPIVFGPDAPVTGGYPVIAVVRDLSSIAQARPGDVVRFDLG